MLFFILIISLFLKLSLADPWKDFLNPHKNITGVNGQCKNDTDTWLHSLNVIEDVTLGCVITKKCSKREEKLLEENFWALEQLDSFGKFPSTGLFQIPLIFDGSYQECQRIKKYETNYCYVLLIPGKDSSHCHLSKSGDPTPTTVFLRSAVCMPDSCDQREVSDVIAQISRGPYTVCGAYCSKVPVQKTPAFWAFSTFLGVMTVIVLAASVIDYLMESKNDSLGLKMLLTFSLWTNAGVILSVKEQKPGFIKCLDCIRFLSMLWVVSGHTMSTLMFPDVLLPITTFTHHLWNHLLLNAFYSVDTFFLLSGLVVSYLFFKTKLKIAQIKSPMTWILFYIHRYLRLTPPYMIFIGFYVVYSEYVQGPTAAAGLNSITYAVNACQKTWWRNLLYINNFGDSTQACYGISWYLAVDTQLYLIAPIILISLWISLALGLATVILGCLGSVATVYILYLQYHLPADQFGKGNVLEFGRIIYQKPWIRCTPYLIGMLVGYGLAGYGSRKIRLSWILKVSGWLLALGIALACLFSTNDYDKGAPWTDFEKATYYNFSRILWSLAVSWVIIANHMGWGGPIDAFMSHPMWQPFGRLSYCAYIVHFFMIDVYTNINDSPMHYYSTFQVWIYYAVPITLLAYIFAFFWSCFFEIPTLKLEKMMVEGIVGSRRKEKAEESKL
uniref:NRF domain-containing protein n=1 Tax=Caenorhabditis tropicalis TaxID=1561998 RepID=A0A1I7UU44_9PELO